MKIGELFVALGFQVDDSQLSAFDQGVKKLKKNLLLIPAIATAAAFAIDRFVASSTAGAVALQNFTIQTGLFSDKLQQLQIVGQLSDISLGAAEITQQVQALQMNLKQIELGGGNVRPFAFLGISPIGKDAFQIIEELRTAIQGVDPARASLFLQELGLSPNFIALLKNTNKELLIFAEDFAQSEETRSSLIDLGTAMTKFKIQLKFVKDLITAALTPVLKELINVFSNVLKGLVLIGENFGIMAEQSEGFANVIRFVLAPAIALLMITLSPLFSMLLAFMLIMEDIFVFTQGGKSALGLLVDKLKEIGVPLDDIFIGFKKAIIEAGQLIDTWIIKPLDRMAQIFRLRREGSQAFGLAPGDIQGLQTMLGNAAVTQSTSNINNFFTINTNASEDRILAGMERFMDKNARLVNAELNAGAAF